MGGRFIAARTHPQPLPSGGELGLPLTVGGELGLPILLGGASAELRFGGISDYSLRDLHIAGDDGDLLRFDGVGGG